MLKKILNFYVDSLGYFYSEGELLEPQQMMLPQGVGPSTSAGHIQVVQFIIEF
jgi:hypothetical protein